MDVISKYPVFHCALTALYSVEATVYDTVIEILIFK
jgi:hypothetical protein